jgi:hypothetical protein
MTALPASNDVGAAKEGSMRTILLGEAPKDARGFAFDYRSWTTEQIAAVVGVRPFDINRVFYVMNVFELPQRALRNGFDAFSRDAAVEAIGRIWFESQRVICVGSRVAAAMEMALDLDPGAIPKNRFARFSRTARGSGWELARIPHPSSLRGREDYQGLVLPPETRSFLLRAAGLDDGRSSGR